MLRSCRAKSRHPVKLPLGCTAEFLDSAWNDTDGMGSGKFQTLDPQRFLWRTPCPKNCSKPSYRKTRPLGAEFTAHPCLSQLNHSGCANGRQIDALDREGRAGRSSV